MRGAVIFNIGDFLMRWSNDDLKSTLHRVVAPPRKTPEETMTPERFSIPYVSLLALSLQRQRANFQFVSADPGLTIDAIPGTW